ncbi:hypothetical protein K461DRAFT_57894 [Myriangium duriaei CBS 260.36]|uniref:Uncharacterized protein n=1 Tax=Myriangium duriaei CBS 260.36 TaxID=1168546 RepID=A0A9P4ISE3_9PEZI|nr:hypothetical protein K461DRAFT_57894 [Myriangium duriaei CBS 260.36]
MATRSAQKHFAAADRVGVVRSLVDLKVSCRDALGLSNPISQRIEFALFLTQTLHDVADSLELPAARDGFLVAFESLTHAREGTDSSWLSVCVETGTAQEPSRLTAQSLALDGYSKQGLHARDGAAVNATSTEYLSPAFSEAQASTTSKSDTAIFTPTASRSLSISDPSKGDPSNGLADAHSTTITESDTLTLPSRHHFSRNAASPEGPLKAAVPSGSPKSLKRTRALQENRQTIPSKKKAKGGCRQEYRSTDKDCEAVTKKTRQALQIHKPSDAGNGGVQICRHAIESLLIGRKVMPDSPWTVDKLVYDLQEFADSLRNDGDNANYQRSNLPEFIDGMGKTFATFASYFEELIEGMELVRLTRTSERLPPEGDHAQQCLYHHRAFHSKSAQCNVLTLGRFHDLYQLRVAHCALVEELSMVGKPIHHWARMNSVPSLQKAAICSRYLAHLAASECPGTFESTLLSIQHDLTLSSKLYDIVQEVGPGFLILLAKHLTPSQSVCPPVHLCHRADLSFAELARSLQSLSYPS